MKKIIITTFLFAALVLAAQTSLKLEGTTIGTVNSSKAYRYVRYIGRHDVRCNIAELEFWGYAGKGDNSHVGQVTNLPTISIHTTNNQMINSKETYVKGIVSVIDGAYFHTDSLDIRGHGNASWVFPKKPYRMKLYNKTQLLGNPANEKNWTLINNYCDKTLMRNLIAFDISRRMEIWRIYTHELASIWQLCSKSGDFEKLFERKNCVVGQQIAICGVECPCLFRI
ncbi:MAG: CotH kinase family protein [Tannerella sp.]|jgi:hypothetical protein|nr:CotH kinase family protein [Tannerella sp.]